MQRKKRINGVIVKEIKQNERRVGWGKESVRICQQQRYFANNNQWYNKLVYYFQDLDSLNFV